MQTGFVRSSLRRPDLGVDTGRRDRAIAPTLNTQRQAKRGVLPSVLDLAQPAFTGRRELELDGALLESDAAFGAEAGKRHAQCSDGTNISSSHRIRVARTDIVDQFSHHPIMAAPERGDWYLREWFATLGKIQRDLVTQLDYPPATANALWHGVQRYRRDHIQDISALLNVQPYELLMPPEEAMALRRLRSAIAEVASTPMSDPTVEIVEPIQVPDRKAG